MLYNKLQGWRFLHKESEYPNVALVLHTSCVAFSIEDLMSIRKLSYQWLIPDNVYYELTLLKRSAIFKENANYILQQTQRVWSDSPSYPERRWDWDLEDLYDNASIKPEQIYDGTLIFLFGDRSKMEEFLHHAGRYVNHFLYYYSGWGYKNGDVTIQTVSSLKGLSPRKAHILNAYEKADDITKKTYVNLSNGKKLNGLSLKNTGKGGTYSNIYTIGIYPNELIKVYKMPGTTPATPAVITGIQLNKIKVLQSLSKTQLSRLNIALPKELLMDGSNRAYGYVMKKVRGRQFKEFLQPGWEGMDFDAICRNLFLLLLELHSLHIMANDLSFNNILIDSNNRVYFVDCDSFQITDFPGGPVTYFYQHPDVKDSDFSRKRREPIHEYFALAVLLFQGFFGFENPLTQKLKRDDKEELRWTESKFVLDVNDTFGNNKKANSRMLKMWIDYPKELRQAFADEFHFRKNLSIGAWVRLLELS